MSDTGFPEPFCKFRNTTRIHPDAKVGNDAIIGGDSHMMMANKRRFSVKHNDRHTISWGSIDPNDNAINPIEARRAGRSSLSRFLNSTQDPSMPNMVPSLPVSLRRGVSFAIAEGDEEDAVEAGILSAADVAEIVAANGLEQDPSLSLVERRRHDGHHRLGSVDSGMSSDSISSEPHACSGDEGPDSSARAAASEAKPRKKRSFFRLIGRVSSRSSLPREDSF